MAKLLWTLSFAVTFILAIGGTWLSWPSSACCLVWFPPTSLRAEAVHSHVRVFPRRAVAVYLDDFYMAGEQLRWLIYSLNQTIRTAPCDLILFFNPTAAAESYIPPPCKGRPSPNSAESSPFRCFSLPSPCDPAYQNYSYLNSIHFLTTPEAIAVLSTYDFVCKSDIDVFFTPLFDRWYPSRLQIGRGAYVNDEVTRNRLHKVAFHLGLRHQGIHNIGATWYGRSPIILELARLTMKVSLHILQHEFREGPGAWPSWYRGVTSMYGSEIAVNHLVNAGDWEVGRLDGPCTHGKTCEYAHIHAWQTSANFNKFALAEGSLDGTDVDGLDLYESKNYAMFVALKANARDASRGVGRQLELFALQCNPANTAEGE